MIANILNTQQALAELSKVLDFSTREEPAVVFFIGAGGSGKTFLGRQFGEAVKNNEIGVVEFDDAPKQFGMERWEKHLGDYTDRDSCIKAFVSSWIVKMAEANRDNKLVIGSINIDPDLLLEVLKDSDISDFSIVLVQPSEEVRRARLANDESRAYMPKEALKAQFESTFPGYLIERTEQLGIPRILGEELERSIGEVAVLATKLLRDAV